MKLLLLVCIAWSERSAALLNPSRLPASRIYTASCQRAPFPCAEEAEVPAAEVEEVAESAAPPPRSKGKKIPIEELEVGATVEGTIRSVQSYGAFIDLGASTDGLLHVSEMSDEFVKDANDMFKVGDTASVRIKSINLEKGQVALSCKSESSEAPRRSSPRRGKVDLSEYENADEKEFITGTVNSITSYGAFVTLKEGVDGLVHISAIQDGGVGKVEDVLSEGQQVQVRVVSFDGAKRRIGLSMKPWVEGGEEAASGGRRPRRSRDEDEDDAVYHMSEEELADLALTVEPVGIEVLSPFDAAFARADEKKAAKAAGKRYADVVL